MANKGLKKRFVTWWFSPRGFSNEGTYFFGTIGEYAEFKCDRFRKNIQGETHCLQSSHYSLDAAEQGAEKLVKQSQRRKHWGEQDYTAAQRYEVKNEG